MTELLTMKEFIQKKYKAEMRNIIIGGFSIMILFTIIALLVLENDILAIWVEVLFGIIIVSIGAFWQHNISFKGISEITEQDLSFRYIKSYNKYVYDNALHI